jgi:hypothetical protein
MSIIRWLIRIKILIWTWSYVFFVLKVKALLRLIRLIK